MTAHPKPSKLRLPQLPPLSPAIQWAPLSQGPTTPLPQHPLFDLLSPMYLIQGNWRRPSQEQKSCPPSPAIPLIQVSRGHTTQALLVGVQSFTITGSPLRGVA